MTRGAVIYIGAPGIKVHRLRRVANDQNPGNPVLA